MDNKVTAATTKDPSVSVPSVNLPPVIGTNPDNRDTQKEE